MFHTVVMEEVILDEQVRTETTQMRDLHGGFNVPSWHFRLLKNEFREDICPMNRVQRSEDFSSPKSHISS